LPRRAERPSISQVSKCYNESIMPIYDALIATKFHVPSAGAELIPRPQLYQLLEQGLHLPLTLLSAPPGFGKTMLAAGWIHSRAVDDNLNICWLSLDESDNASRTFWRYFVASIQHGQPKASVMAQAMLNSPTLPDFHSILGALINELAALDTPLLIVLDDYHLIRSPGIHDNLVFFLDHIPENAHLVLLTREDPPLALARRRARRQMIEIRAADLRFDTRETTGFLNVIRKLALTPEQIALLEQRTEGWIAGLQMVALSMQGRDAQSFFESFSDHDRYIAEYLIEEVLEHQDEVVRAFLLKTSVLERLSVSLCAALVGDTNVARSTLDYLERANLFLIPLDSRREWYRYHHLFADLLRQRLRESHSVGEVTGLNRSASAWYESQGNISAAVRHASQIPDMARAMELLEQYAGLFFAGNELPQLVELARNLPVAQIQDHPNLCMAVTWASLATGEPYTAWLEIIEKHFALSADVALTDESLAPATRAALLEVLLLREQEFETFDPNKRERLLAIQRQMDALPADQICLFNTTMSLKPIIRFDLSLDAEQSGDTDLAARYFTETVNLASQDHNYHLHFLSLGHLANVQASQSHLRLARQTHEHALTLYKTGSASPYAALAHAGLSALHYEWSDLAAVEEHLNKGLPLSRSWTHWESLAPLTLTSARLEYRRGNVDKAISILDEMKVPPLDVMRLALEAYTALLRSYNSDQASASSWLAAKVTPSTLEPSPANESALLDVVRLMASLQRLDDAIALLQKISRVAERGGRIRTLIQAKVILSKAMLLKGNSSDASLCLEEVLRLAMPEGYISTFVDEGETIRQLLSDLKSKVPSELRNYVERVLMGFGVSENQAIKRETGSGSDLSEREKEILSLIAEGLSNQEIAARLVISITTVKTHVGNIFNKLGVTSRTQALARAAELGLLPGK